LPANGSTDVVFRADYDGKYYLTAYQCPTDSFDRYICDPIGGAHPVAVYDEVVSHIEGRGLRGPATPFSVTIAPGGVSTYDVDWEVAPAGQPDAAPLVSGVAHDVDQQFYTIDLPGIGPSDVLVQGQRYRYQATLHTDRDPYGPLEGSVFTEFEWDEVNFAKGIRLGLYDEFLREDIRDPEVFYPQRDRAIDWRDTVEFEVVKDGPEVMRETELSVTDSNGDEVWHDSRGGAGGTWSGRDFDEVIVPEGTYDLHATVVDRQGNAETFVRSIRVSRERLVQMTKEWTLAPKRTMIEKFVGRCASTESPARADWPGSIGLRSSTTGPRCRTPEAQSVQTVHGIYLPPSPFNRYRLYDQVRVSTYGGERAVRSRPTWSTCTGRATRTGWVGGSSTVASNGIVARRSGRTPSSGTLTSSVST